MDSEEPFEEGKIINSDELPDCPEYSKSLEPLDQFEESKIIDSDELPDCSEYTKPLGLLEPTTEELSRDDKLKLCLKWHANPEKDTKWVKPVLLPSGIHMKRSCGIILHRFNEKHEHEFLLLRKRHTHAFNDFVLGKYADIGRSLNYLLSNMTREELLLVNSLDFAMLWYHVWLSKEKTANFISKEHKFNSCFINYDGGESFRRRLKNITPNGFIQWEFPKGRPQRDETDLMCAVRELKEETGINKSDYYIIPGAVRYDNFCHSGTRYSFKYFMACAYANLNYKSLNSQTIDCNDFCEIGDVKWFTVDKIHFIDDKKKHLQNIIKPALAIVKKYKRAKWVSKF
jgi:ADP-ribose pyrophosphatase YjhB (NUDIX family)